MILQNYILALSYLTNQLAHQSSLMTDAKSACLVSQEWQTGFDQEKKSCKLNFPCMYMKMQNCWLNLQNYLKSTGKVNWLRLCTCLVHPSVIYMAKFSSQLLYIRLYIYLFFYQLLIFIINKKVAGFLISNIVPPAIYKYMLWNTYMLKELCSLKKNTR